MDLAVTSLAVNGGPYNDRVDLTGISLPARILTDANSFIADRNKPH